MKKMMSILVAALSVPLLSWAQWPDTRHEVSIGTGVLPVGRDNVGRMSGVSEDYYYLSIGDRYSYVVDPEEIIEQSRYYYGGVHSTWAFSAGYMYSVYKWLHVGGLVSFHNVSRNKYETLSGRRTSTMQRNYISVIPTVRFSYLNRKYVKLYSSIGIGYCGSVVRNFDSRKKRLESFAAYDITYFGVSAGGRLFGSVELGVYTAGYVKFAIGYRF